MRSYELMVILLPELGEEGLSEMLDNIREWITSEDGKIVNLDNWGRRKLAYPIRKIREGNYLLYDLELDPTSIPEIERNIGLSESVLRYLIVRKEEVAGEEVASKDDVVLEEE